MHRLAQLLAATLRGVAAVAVVPAGSASAAACSRGTGVSVVVGNDVRCDANGGGSAMSSFRDVGHSLQDYRGFVCRIDGAPSNPSACSGYPPADAYWGLFWSNGTSGSWVYSGEGAATLDVPKGGWVAFVWQDSESKRYPGVKPVSAAPAPTKKPAPAPTRTSAAASAKPTPSASPSTVAEKKADEKRADDSKKATAKAEKTAAAATETPTPAEPTANEADIENASESPQSAGTLWAGGAIALALLAGMGGLWWRRKLSGGAS
ncbi:MAG: hypothetical protein ABWX71_09810 [Aeromicrobium sp.]